MIPVDTLARVSGIWWITGNLCHSLMFLLVIITWTLVTQPPTTCQLPPCNLLWTSLQYFKTINTRITITYLETWSGRNLVDLGRNQPISTALINFYGYVGENLNDFHKDTSHLITWVQETKEEGLKEIVNGQILGSYNQSTWLCERLKCLLLIRLLSYDLKCEWRWFFLGDTKVVEVRFQAYRKYEQETTGWKPTYQIPAVTSLMQNL